jgi:hypothetical protein
MIVILRYANAAQTIRAAIKSAVFFLKVLPMLPSRPIDWFTSKPVREHVTFSTSFGEGSGDLYRPSRPGPYPGVVFCLGVVPFGFDHPQIPILGAALARSGYAALLYRSHAMEDYRIDPEDVGNMAAAFHYLIERPFVHADRCGIFGTCVGGAFALLAAAHEAIRDRVAFVGAFAPYASMRMLALEIACSTRLYDKKPEPWQVDPLTRKVFVHSLTAKLQDSEADQLRGLFDKQSDQVIEVDGLSQDAESVFALFTASDPEQAQIALSQLPSGFLARMNAMSPICHFRNIRAPSIILGHDIDDNVIPIGESRCLRNATPSRKGLRYTEFAMFQHADPTKRKLRPVPLAKELWKFYKYVYPMFGEAVR